MEIVVREKNSEDSLDDFPFLFPLWFDAVSVSSDHVPLVRSTTADLTRLSDSTSLSAKRTNRCIASINVLLPGIPESLVQHQWNHFRCYSSIDRSLILWSIIDVFEWTQSLFSKSVSYFSAKVRAWRINSPLDLICSSYCSNSSHDWSVLTKCRQSCWSF